MNNQLADRETSVADLYQDKKVALEYEHKRFFFSWQRLLHWKQVNTVQRLIHEYNFEGVLELAPGPARLAKDIEGISSGYMVEYSQEMLEVVRNILHENGKDSMWNIVHGNAFNLQDLSELQEKFSMIYSFRFIRHFEVQDRSRLYGHIHDRLAKNGILIFDVVNKVIRDKLDARSGPKTEDRLPVFDATYTVENFKQEMQENVFDVLDMIPVLGNFKWQSWLSYKLDDVIPGISSRIQKESHASE